MEYFQDAQKTAKAAARATANGPTFKMAGRLYRSVNLHAANLWLTTTADLEGIRLDDPRVARARNWLKIICAVEA